MEIIRDIKFIFRLFIKYRGSSVLGIVVLGLGLGMSITMFSLIKGVMWSAPQVADGKSMVLLKWANDRRRANFNDKLSSLEYAILQDQAKNLEDVIAYFEFSPAVYIPQGGAPATRYQMARVTDSFFEVVATKPLLGQVVNDDNSWFRRTGSVVISYRVWQEQFGGLSDVVGKMMQINGMPRIVIGVMPPEFHFPSNNDVWVLLKFREEARKQHALKVIGVRKVGVSIAQVNTELYSLSNQIREQYPDTNRDRTKMTAEPYNSSFVGKNLKAVLLLICIASLLVFVVACANVSNLLMMRVSRRQNELAVRKILGAGRHKIVMQVILEGLLFSIGGAVAGLLMSYLGSRYIWALFLQNYNTAPYWWSMAIDWQVYLFAVLIMLLAMIFSSFTPAIRVIAKQSTVALQENTRTLSGVFIGNIAKGFVAVQVMCLTILMVFTFLLVFLLHYLTDWDLSFDPNKILTAKIQLNQSAGFESGESLDRFYDNVVRDLQALPGINGAAFSGGRGGILTSSKQFEIEGDNTMQVAGLPYAGSNIVSNSFFDVFDLQATAGRLFLGTDIESSQKVAVVNQHFVDAYFPGERALGERVRVYRPTSELEILSHNRFRTEWMTIVGVVPNIQHKLLPGEKSVDRAEIYIPVKQRRTRGLWLLVKAAGNIKDWIKPTSEIIYKYAPTLAPNKQYQTVQNLFDIVDSELKAMTKVVTLFAIVALIISLAGLYGVISFTSLLQRREFGVRSALGASSGRIFELVFRRGAWLMVIGLLPGIVAAIIFGSTLKQNLGVMNLPVMMPSHLVGIGVVIVAGIIAISVPAIRAMRASTSEALRVD